MRPPLVCTVVSVAQNRQKMPDLSTVRVSKPRSDHAVVTHAAKVNILSSDNARHKRLSNLAVRLVLSEKHEENSVL